MDETSLSHSEKSPLISSVSERHTAPKHDHPVFTVPPRPRITWRHVLVGPATFAYMCSFNISFFTFGQFVYKKLQTQKFPGASIDSSISVCYENTSSTEYQMQVDVQEDASLWGIYFYLAGGVISIFSNLYLGSLTDRYGRKFLFIVPTLGSIVRTTSNVLLIYYDIDLQYFLFGYVVEGFTGQIFNIIQVSYIYMADITTTGRQRSLAIVMMEVIIGLGTSLPSLAAGFLLQATGFIWPFILALGLLVLALLLMLLLPETFAKDKRSNKRSTSKLDSLKDAADLYFSKKNAGRRWMYIIMLVIFALYSYTLLGRNAIEGLYQLNAPFCWNPQELGIYGTLKGGLSQLVGLAFVKLFHLCMNDELIAVIGCVSAAASFILEAFAQSDVVLYLDNTPRSYARVA